MACAEASSRVRACEWRGLPAWEVRGDALCAVLTARGGHLAVLHWARQNGCPWGEYTTPKTT